MKKILSEFLNDEIGEIELFNAGFISQTYKLNGLQKTYIMRSLKNSGDGFEYPHDALRSFTIAHEMYERAQPINDVKSYGVVEHEGEVYHIQDFVLGKIINLEDYTPAMIESVAQKLGELHYLGKEFWKTKSDTEKKSLYHRSLREMITNHETLLSTYEKYAHREVQLPLLQSILEKAFKRYLQYVEKNNFERVTFLHGDFWHNNILISDQNIFFIDFSRIPHGEPGLDVSHFLTNLEIKEIQTGEKKYGELISSFLKKYIETTGDNEIINYLDMNRLFILYINLCKLVQQHLNQNQEELNHLAESVLKRITN